MISGSIINADSAVIPVTFIFPLAVPKSHFERKIGPKLGRKGHFNQFWAKIAYGGPPGEFILFSHAPEACPSV